MVGGVSDRRPQLSDEVASHLRQAIMVGELAPGASVRAEAVGEELDVSATPVREALQALRAEGFLELVPRRGFRVAPLVSEDILDIFEAHALIAGELAARATGRATQEEIGALLKLHDELMAAAEAGDHEMLERKNHQFHAALYRIAKSARLLSVLATLAKYVPRAFYAQIEGWPQTTARDHAAVIDAVVAHDPDAAREAMANHIRNSGQQLAEHFSVRQAVPVGR